MLETVIVITQERHLTETYFGNWSFNLTAYKFELSAYFVYAAKAQVALTLSA